VIKIMATWPSSPLNNLGPSVTIDYADALPGWEKGSVAYPGDYAHQGLYAPGEGSGKVPPTTREPGRHVVRVLLSDVMAAGAEGPHVWGYWPEDDTVAVASSFIISGALMTGYLFGDDELSADKVDLYLGPTTRYGLVTNVPRHQDWAFRNVRDMAGEGMDAVRRTSKIWVPMLGVQGPVFPKRDNPWPHKCDRCGAPALHMSSIIDCSKKCCRERTY
jgi:hypothetical protein